MNTYAVRAAVKFEPGHARQPCNSAAPAWAFAGFGIGAVTLLHYYVRVFLLQGWKMQASQEFKQEHCSIMEAAAKDLAIAARLRVKRPAKQLSLRSTHRSAGAQHREGRSRWWSCWAASTHWP